MKLIQLQRLGGAFLATALVAGAVAGPVLAASTRTVYIGTPNGAIADGYGSLSYTQAKAGGKAAVDIQVRNDGGQTLNHANLYGGEAADAAVVNPLFPPPAGPSLPAGLTYAAVYPLTSGVSCSITAAGRSLACDLGTFPGQSSKAIRVVLQTSAGTADGTNTWFGAFFAEGNATGTNQDNFYAQGALGIGLGACADADYFLSGGSISLATPACGTTSGKVSTKTQVGGNGTYATISVTGAVACPAGYTCYGNTVSASVLGGANVSGGVQWTIRWTGSNTIKGAIHFWDSYDPAVAANADDYNVIPFTKRFQCSAKLTTNCWSSIAASKNTANPLWFEATFITPNNGKGGGFI